MQFNRLVFPKEREKYGRTTSTHSLVRPEEPAQQLHDTPWASRKALAMRDHERYACGSRPRSCVWISITVCMRLA